MLELHFSSELLRSFIIKMLLFSQLRLLMHSVFLTYILNSKSKNFSNLFFSLFQKTLIFIVTEQPIRERFNKYCFCPTPPPPLPFTLPSPSFFPFPPPLMAFRSSAFFTLHFFDCPLSLVTSSFISHYLSNALILSSTPSYRNRYIF